ncbi:hypothetical protein ACER0C_025968 [Sarotherodon galilaeus]
MSAEPPPYRPHFPEGPSAPAFSPALACQPGVFPSSPYQTFPQSYYHEHPGYMAPMTPQSTFGTQSAYQGRLEGPPGASYPPKHAGRSKVTIQRAQAGSAQTQSSVFMCHIYVMDQQQDRGGGRKSCLAACSTLLCCCCLWDLLTQHLC